jgi:predicted MFS family arabinose efflux permease
MAFFSTTLAAATGFILFNVVISFSFTGRTIFSQETVQPRWRTTVNAVLIISTAVAIGGAGLAGGRIIPTLGFTGMFVIGAALALLAVLLYVAWYFLSKRRARTGAAEQMAIPEELQVS